LDLWGSGKWSRTVRRHRRPIEGQRRIVEKSATLVCRSFIFRL
jgi:hypothetical protein